MKINEGSLTDNNIVLDTLEVFLDNTTFYILSGYGAFAMCGALNVDVYNTPIMASRGVLAHAGKSLPGVHAGAGSGKTPGAGTAAL